MPKDPPTPSASLDYTGMPFLVSHGLQTPLSALRWACGRLSKTDGNFSQEQKDLLQGIRREARLLSRMFDWLLLLAKTEEGAGTQNVQEIYLHDFLQSAVSSETFSRPLTFSVECPDDLQVQVDRTLLESIVHALLLTVAVASDAETAAIKASVEGSSCVLTVTAPLTLIYLTDVPGKRKVVGGVEGFLLAIASSFARSVGGELRPQHQEDAVSAIRLVIPTHPTLSSLLQ